MNAPLPLDSLPPGPPAARIAFIHATWHADIVERCRDAFLAHVSELSQGRVQVDVFPVAGAFELPLHAKLLARTRRYQAVVAAGLVVDGGIYRHEFVAQSVVGGLMQVQLETLVPVLSAVLTPHHFHAHETHGDFFREHFLAKGEEAARAALGTLASIAEIERPASHAAAPTAVAPSTLRGPSP